MVQDELSDSYLQEILQHLAELDFPNGLCSAQAWVKQTKAQTTRCGGRQKEGVSGFIKYSHKKLGYSFSIHRAIMQE
jgi:hypothetical protein